MTPNSENYSCRTYEFAKNPPPVMSWQEYARRVMAEWIDLLDSPEATDERAIHNFLIKHPSMVPGAYSISGGLAHGPASLAMLSESPLSGLGMKIPDLIWLARNSGTFGPVFVEIENPSKRWFTKQQVPTSDFVQAVNQLAEWRAWLNRPTNMSVFYENFEMPNYVRDDLTFRPEFVLIYGRRKEFDERPQLIRLRDQFEKQDQTVMTFDRLRPSHDRSFYITAAKRKEGYDVLAVPATFTLDPHTAMHIIGMNDLDKAIQRNDWISEERRRFLVERLPYWREWANSPWRGIISGGCE